MIYQIPYLFTLPTNITRYILSNLMNLRMHHALHSILVNCVNPCTVSCFDKDECWWILVYNAELSDTH